MFVNHVNRHAYRFGATFIDSETGLRVVGTHPQERRDLWRAYLDGAEARYAHHGVERALDRREVERSGCSLFWAVIDTDANMVGGLRVHGPLLRVADASALTELAGCAQLPGIIALLQDRLRSGIVEIKGTWAEAGLARHAADSVARLLSRCTIHSLRWFDVGWGLCTAHAASTAMFAAAGARLIPGVAPVPYPDHRFATVPMLWDHRRLRDNADEDMLMRADDESFQMRITSAMPAGKRPARKASRSGLNFTRR